MKTKISRIVQRLQARKLEVTPFNIVLQSLSSGSGKVTQKEAEEYLTKLI